MAEFKVGDEVAVSDRRGPVAVRKVARVTLRLVELDDGSKWRSDGYELGSRREWPDRYIRAARREDRDIAARRIAMRRLEVEMRRVDDAVHSRRLESSLADIEAATAALAKLEVKA